LASLAPTSLGRYELPSPAGPITVAVKITDMLGEEVLITKRLE
jgi:hypothetical protein